MDHALAKTRLIESALEFYKVSPTQILSINDIRLQLLVVNLQKSAEVYKKTNQPRRNSDESDDSQTMFGCS
jgi:hypothetical protein